MSSSLVSLGRLSRARRTVNRSAPPVDLESFWSDTLEALLLVPPSARLVADSEEAPVEVEFLSLGGAKIRAWVSAKKEEGGQGRPLLITCHGYGGEMDPERVRRLASFGLNVIGVDIRGFGRSRDALEGLSPYGYLLTGARSEQESILRGAVCDYIQAYRCALDWFGPSDWVTFQGFSFAGGLATMASSVVACNQKHPEVPRQPDVLAIGAPTFGHVENRLQYCEAGSGMELVQYLKHHPSRRAAVTRVFSYFDTTHHAALLGNDPETYPKRVLAGVGAYDPVVPAETVYPVFNALPEKPELFEVPCSHTTLPEEKEWVRWEGAWIRAAKKKRD